MRRVSVVGMSGSGKSTLARAIAERLAVPYLELDAIHHLPDWQALPLDEFLAEVDRRTAGDGWVVDGNYRAVVREGPVWQRADTVVWLDLPKRQTLRQVTWRAMRRAITREELWNGNRERLAHHLQWDGLIFWALRTHGIYKREYESLLARPEHQHLRVVHLRHPREARRWLAPLETGRVDEPSLR